MLGTGEIDVWEIGLEQPDETTSRLYRSLSAAERERADRFRFPHLRRRWAISHAALRAILGRYSERSPEELEFQLGPFGKPSLLASPGLTPPHFNLSHSQDLALLAVASDEVGIDIEYMKPDREWLSLAEQVFSERERSQLMRHLAELRPRLFFELWTRKEAYIKGRGLGLSLPLQAFHVPVDDADDIGRVEVEARWDDGRVWRLVRVPIPQGSYAATLAYPDSAPRQRRFLWQG